MPTIQHPRLSVAKIPDHPGQRQIRVSYELVIAADDDNELTSLVAERIAVHGIDFHDAPVQPSKAPLLVNEASYEATTGTMERLLERTVSRDQLDVEGDWWSSDLDGEVVPLAEWIDHLVAEIHVTIDGRVLDSVRTDVVTGSWGALGSD